VRSIRALIALAAALLACAALPAVAQTVTSAAPDSVSVTIYRDPDRSADTALELGWLRGYALVSERRTVRIPAGRAVVRFEGVAGGILPESAIVTGLPDGVLEKNLDADLLSPASLYGRSYGRPVTIRHRRADGTSVEEPAIIRSGPEGAAIFETRNGFIAADCEFGRDTIVYESVPAGLSARPTLSIETQSSEARDVTITLSYLAWGFDWQANYVATMRPDGRSADLFAWVTLANGDVTSFADAQTMVIGGKVNREDDGDHEPLGSSEPLEFKCFSPREPVPMPPVMPMAAPPPVEMMDGEIVVTASRMPRMESAVAVQVVAEELGDLKLFRIPQPTTVAANSQKQVSLLARQAVPVEIVYRSAFHGEGAGSVTLVLRAQNRENLGLGLALPAGKVAVFEPQGDANLLIGQGSIADKAIGEEVEIEMAPATQVTASAAKLREAKGWGYYSATVRNANPFPVRFEASLNMSGGKYRFEGRPKLGRKHGYDLWQVEVPANGSATLRYRFRPDPR
jgi:hypothetical protein